MKTVTARNLQKGVKTCLDSAQTERVVITRRGEPSVLMVGVEGLDWESVVVGSDEAFWRLVEKRRHEETMSASDFWDHVD